MTEVASSFAPPFRDPRNITVGIARVIWAPATAVHAAGYVLPGGLRTTDRHEAHAAAVRMNELASRAATDARH